MLVLARHIGEQIVIGGDIVISVTAVQGNKVKLGIVAPASVMVDRGEVHQRRAEFSPAAVTLDTLPREAGTRGAIRLA
jgi:carbon storage regulator